MATVDNQKVWVGFDLGGTKMLATVYDSNWTVLGRKRKKTKGHLGVETGVVRIAETIRAALDEAGDVASERVRGIGIGCPGPVDYEKGVVLDAVNLGWKNVAIRKALQQKFDCPVVVTNDVDAGVYAENRFGAAQKARCVLGIFPGTGIGGGCVYDGRIVRGSRLSCMEIGHIQVTPNGRLCGCGRRGCLETEASRLAIAASAAMAAYRGEAPHLLEQIGTTVGEIRSGVLAESIAAGDKAVEVIVRIAAEHLGRAVATMVNVLIPDVIVLGGGLVEAMPKLWVSTVQRVARETVMELYGDSFRVTAAELGDDASVLGAAAWAAEVIAEQERRSATAR